MTSTQNQRPAGCTCNGSGVTISYKQADGATDGQPVRVVYPVRH